MSHPRHHSYTIFLLDAGGALLSMLFLVVVYVFDAVFGMPKDIVEKFICIAVFCCMFSSGVFLMKPAHWPLYLIFVAIVNSAYCLFTLYHVLNNYGSLTLTGRTYFFGELVVIFLLSVYEMYLARCARR